MSTSANRDQKSIEDKTTYSKKMEMTLELECYHIPRLIISYFEEDDQDDRVLSLET